MATVMTSRAFAAAAALAFLAPAGCSKDKKQETSKAAPKTARQGDKTAATKTAPAPKPEQAPQVAQVGKLAPDFTAEAHTGKTITLSALRGQPVVLYFYPKDETPG